ncbi:hypothetical protein JG688_00016928, partial [Phytophthora aleatoria]
MPFFARRFIHHSLGLPELADQECMDLMYNIELTREQYPQVSLFASFLREIFDEDTLLFFLFVRSQLQDEFDLDLAAKEKQAHSSRASGSKKYIAANMIELRNHPLIPDGTKQVFLSKAACESVMLSVFDSARCFRYDEARRIAAPILLARYIVREPIVSRLQTDENHFMVSAEIFLTSLVKMFGEVAEDILAQFKFNDDGESLTNLIRLRDTITLDSKVDKFVALYAEQERSLRNQKIELMKMERSNTNNQFRVQIRLLQNQIRLQEQELQHTQNKITDGENLVNNVWKEVIALISVLGRFEAHIGRLQKKHGIAVKASVLLAVPWQQQMEELRLPKKYVVGVRTEKILLATYKGDYTTVKRAIVNGFWYVLDNEGNSILHLAAAAGHKRLVKLCLRNSFDINLVNYHNQTALHLLLANLPPSSAVYDVSDVRIRDERVALAEYMIEHGAWHEAPDEEGFTPLLLCASLGQSEAVDMLLNHGANTEARTSGSNLNAPQLAVEGNYSATLKVLLESGSFDTRDTVFGYDALNLCDSEGYTPLIYAVSNGYLDATECLLEADAGPDVKDYFGRSPLHFALISADASTREALVNLLIQYEADVNVKDTDGDAPLHVSCVDDDRLACTHLLLTSGALICANALGNHPTHIAARNGAVDTLKLLIDYGGDMNLKNYDGKTPLGMARMNDQIAVADFVAAYFAQESADKKSAASPELEPVEDDEGNQEDHERSDNQNDGLLEQNLEDENLHKNRTISEWVTAVSEAYCMGSIAEWTQYIDAATEVPFYDTMGPSGEHLYTWDTPVEFDASMGEIWEIVRGPSTVAALDEEQDPSSADSRYYLYHNRVTDELTSTIPPINYALLQDVVQNSKRMKLLRARVRKVSADELSASAMEYMRFFRGFEEESAQIRKEMRAAIKIQRHFRARRTHLLIKALLHQNRCAVHLQRAFRGRKARREAKMRRQQQIEVVKIQASYQYLEDPTHLVKMGNYVLYLHTITHDYERARPLYGRLLRVMAQRGPDIPFILFSYGIFLYITQEEDTSVVEEMILRGKIADPTLVKYKVAFLGFFRQAILQNPLDAEAHINYAACVQWLFE